MPYASSETTAKSIKILWRFAVLHLSIEVHISLISQLNDISGHKSDTRDDQSHLKRYFKFQNLENAARLQEITQLEVLLPSKQKSLDKAVEQS